MQHSSVKKLASYPSFTLSGTKLTRHAWQMEPSSFSIDLKRHINLINKLMQQEPPVLLIEGVTGSGKTVLANAIKLSGVNTDLIDLSLFRRDKNASKVSFDTACSTHIVDELNGEESAIFYKAINELKKKRKNVVLFTQDSLDLKNKFRYPVKILKLTRKGLTEAL